MLKQPISIVNYTNVAIVRLKVNKEKFEVACYKNKIKQYREKIENDQNEVLQISEIFTNAVKGDKANKKLLEKIFPNMTKQQIIDLILNKGDIQVSEKERESNLSNIKNDIASIITEKTFNIETGKPFTQNEILQAMNCIGANIKDTEDAKKQALKYIKDIQEKKVLNIERRFMKISFSSSNDNKIEDVNELLNYLKSINAKYDENEYINYKENYQSGNKLICLVQPNFYKEISNKFEGRFIIEQLCINETIAPVENKDKKFNLALESLSLNVSSCKVDAYLESNYEEFKRKIIKCTKCKGSEFGDNILLKAHYKTEWHLLNIKRISSGLESLSIEEYDDYIIMNMK